MSDLREKALDVAIDHVGPPGMPFDPHSWRCYDQERYPIQCNCATSLAESIVPLLAAAWEEGRTLGLRQCDYEYGAAVNMPDLANPYRSR